MKTRRDQIESVMRRSGCSYQQAVAVCQDNLRKWRDEPRAWLVLHGTGGGAYIRVEDE